MADPLGWVARSIRSAPRLGLADAITEQERARDRALQIARAFYAVSLLWVVISSGGWNALRAVETLEPQWPAGWLNRADPGSGIDAILMLYAGAAFVVALWPTSRTARVVYFVGLLQYLSVEFAFGKVNHHMHGWLWVSAVFVFLPTGRRWIERSSAARHRVLAVFWTAQVLVLYFYTLTGIWKLEAIYVGLREGRVTSLHPSGFSLIVAEQIANTNRVTLLGEFIVDNRLLGWGLYNGTIYLEAVSLMVAFRPRLHRLWGGGLIAFHIGTQLAMGFTFRPNIVLLGLLFLCSPWAPDKVRFLDLVRDLPILRFILRRVEALRRSRAQPDPARGADAEMAPSGHEP